MDLQQFKLEVLPLKHQLFRMACRYTSDSDLADDIVQEVFIKCWKHREKLNQVSNLKAWCISVTKNLSIDKIRSKHHGHEDIEGQYQMASTQIGPDRNSILKDQVAQVYRLMDQLPEQQKDVIRLRDVEGYTYEEIADALSLSMSQVKVKLHRARKYIRTKMTETIEYES